MHRSRCYGPPMQSRKILTVTATSVLFIAGAVGVARAATQPSTAGANAAGASAAEASAAHSTVVGVHNTYQPTTFPFFADALDAGAGLVEVDIWADAVTKQWRVNHELVGQSNNCTSSGQRAGSLNQGF